MMITTLRSLMTPVLAVMAMMAVGLTAPAVTTPAMATSISVLAVVDGTPISSIDFELRRHFLIKTTGIEYNEQNRDQIDSDVLQMLIDDIIKVNEGLRFGSGFEASARQRAAELVTQSFSQNGEDPEEVMDRLGIDRQIAEKKFLADVLWASTVQSRYAKQFANTREEAEKELERITTNIMKPHIDIDEIILIPEPNRDFTTTKKLGTQIYNALIKGADFGRIAQQYSAAGSGRNGGELGWVMTERLPERVRNVMEGAPSGSFTQPIEIDGSIAIYRVNGKRENGETDPMESMVELMRLVYPVDINDAAATSSARAKLGNELAPVTSCGQLQSLHDTYGSGAKSDLGSFKIVELAPVMRQLIIGLDKNERTDAINFAEGLVVFMVCERNNPKLILPSIEEVEASIRNRHYSALSARLLSRLRKKAVINYKGNL
ncbi:MAG: peptidylprolyl isomerase [Alphaproteobacteria bacterium]|nr:peptidylprolyl isomerase [Alphaproteobacteria bacterium]